MVPGGIRSSKAARQRRTAGRSSTEPAGAANRRRFAAATPTSAAITAPDAEERLSGDGPLAQYQCTEGMKDDTMALIRSLNKAIPTPQEEGLRRSRLAAKALRI